MGLFDTVNYSGDKLECAKGHKLNGQEFQTKELGCSASDWLLSDSKLELISKGAWWEDKTNPDSEAGPWGFCFYGKCPKCGDKVVFYAKLQRSSVLAFRRDDTPHAYLFC